MYSQLLYLYDIILAGEYIFPRRKDLSHEKGVDDMSMYGVSKGDGYVIFADHETMFSLKDYFADKPEYETTSVLDTARLQFDAAVAEIAGTVMYGYRYDQDDTVFIIAAADKKDGYKYQEDDEYSFHTAYLLAKVERGCNPEKTAIAAEM